ncbi:MAG: NAD-dependent epimerase/dehydratase family protein [Thermoproteota archaeon]|jgi:UDP-glucose 4-epimerase
MQKLSKVIVTGGAGFIGSHLVERLLEFCDEVVVLDNFSSGKMENLKDVKSSGKLKVIRLDLLESKEINDKIAGADVVFHIAANPEVRISEPKVHLEQNVLVTYNILEAMRKTDVKKIVFTSSSTVYGEAKKIPTPEDYGPLEPISMYGAAKLASESLISGYSHTYGIIGFIFRFANVVGKRANHGVIYDFIQKLRKNRKELEILGDGTQRKSYIHVSDCLDAVFHVLDKESSKYCVYNIGNLDSVSVSEIADIVIEEMKLKNVKKKFTGGVEGGRGWIGDVKHMQLDVSKLTSLGWKPKLSSKEAVRRACRELLEDINYP